MLLSTREKDLTKDMQIYKNLQDVLTLITQSQVQKSAKSLCGHQGSKESRQRPEAYCSVRVSLYQEARGSAVGGWRVCADGQEATSEMKVKTLFWGHRASLPSSFPFSAILEKSSLCWVGLSHPELCWANLVECFLLEFNQSTITWGNPIVLKN